jgi:hypothetical protein
MHCCTGHVYVRHALYNRPSVSYQTPRRHPNSPLLLTHGALGSVTVRRGHVGPTARTCSHPIGRDASRAPMCWLRIGGGAGPYFGRPERVPAETATGHRQKPLLENHVTVGPTPQPQIGVSGYRHLILRPVGRRPHRIKAVRVALSAH